MVCGKRGVLPKIRFLVIRNVQLVAGSGRSVAFRRCCWCGFIIHGGQRAFFPHAANELCQVAKLHEAVSPLTSSLPIETRYSKSKTLLVRNMRQVDELRDRFPAAAFNATETAIILRALDNSGTLMSMMATADLIDPRAVAAFEQIESDIATITAKLATPPTNLMPSAAALAQPAWGIAEPEIPLLPISPRAYGV